VRQNAWRPVSVPQGTSTAVGSSARWNRQNAGQQTAAHQEYPDSHAYVVRYTEATEQVYLVQALSDDQLLQVPKSYAPAEQFPIVSSQRAPGARLLRWSVYALLGVGLGGLGGVLLGAPVVLAAGVQLARFARRVRRWRRSRQGTAGIPALPAAAGSERLRLLGAFGQGLLAIVLGGLLLWLLTWHLV
jgi:hypothetical protein